MPRIFVPGPGVRPSAAGQQQAIQGIANTIGGIQKRELEQEQLASDKLFREQTLAQADRKQDFAEGADGRARAEAAFTKKLANDQDIANLDASNKAGFGFVDQFVDNPETAKLFSGTPLEGNREGQREKVMEFAQADNRALFSDASKLSGKVYNRVIKAGGSATQATAEAKRVMASEFPTLSESLISKLVVKPDTTSASQFDKLLSGTGSKGSSTPLAAIPSQLDSEKLQEILKDKINIEGSRVEFPGTSFRLTDFAAYGFGDHDLTEDDVIGLEGEFSKELRPETISRVIQSIGDTRDGTLPFDPRSLSAEQRKNFLTVGQAIEAKANEPRGGGSVLGGTAEQALALQQQQAKDISIFNSDLIARSTAQSNTFEERLSAFRSSLGQPSAATAPTDNPRQGGSEGGVAPPGTPDGSTGSAGLDQLLTPQAAPVGPDPGPGTRTVFNNEPSPEEAAQERFQVFGGNDTPSFQELNTKFRVGEIEQQLKDLPPPISQTLVQKNLKKKLEKELRDLKN